MPTYMASWILFDPAFTTVHEICSFYCQCYLQGTQTSVPPSSAPAAICKVLKNCRQSRQRQWHRHGYVQKFLYWDDGLYDRLETELERGTNKTTNLIFRLQMPTVPFAFDNFRVSLNWRFSRIFRKKRKKWKRFRNSNMSNIVWNF